jgi:hypothetical protein
MVGNMPSGTAGRSVCLSNLSREQFVNYTRLTYWFHFSDFMLSNKHVWICAKINFHSVPSTIDYNAQHLKTSTNVLSWGIH